MTETQKTPSTTEQRAEVRRQKVISLCNLLDRGDYATLKFIQLKLTQPEWDILVAENRCTQEQADYCITHGMLAKQTPKIFREKRYSRWAGSPVEELGKQFDAALSAFITTNEATIATLNSAGFEFHPQFRNKAKVGTRKAKKTISPILT